MSYVCLCQIQFHNTYLQQPPLSSLKYWTSPSRNAPYDVSLHPYTLQYTLSYSPHIESFDPARINYVPTLYRVVSRHIHMTQSSPVPALRWLIRFGLTLRCVVLIDFFWQGTKHVVTVAFSAYLFRGRSSPLYEWCQGRWKSNQTDHSTV